MSTMVFSRNSVFSDGKTQEEDFSNLSIGEVFARKESIMKSISSRFESLKNLEDYAVQKYGRHALKIAERRRRALKIAAERQRRVFKTAEKNMEQGKPEQGQQQEPDHYHNQVVFREHDMNQMEQHSCVQVTNEAKLEASTRNLHRNYQQAENAKKQRRIQVIKFLPNQEFHLGSTTKKPMQDKKRLRSKCNSRFSMMR